MAAAQALGSTVAQLALLYSSTAALNRKGQPEAAIHCRRRRDGETAGDAGRAC